MAVLSLVQSLSRLQQEQKYTDKVEIESVGLTFARGCITEIHADCV